MSFRSPFIAIVIEYRRSHDAQKGVTCLDCHRPVKGQQSIDHRGFTIADTVTPANGASCHQAEYDQFERSRHAAPAWAAVYGSGAFTPAQVAYAEQYQPGAVKRPPNPLVGPEANTAIAAGCATCHSVGKPHADGSIGSCTVCHARHAASVALARLPTRCGQCHTGPRVTSPWTFSMEHRHSRPCSLPIWPCWPPLRWRACRCTGLNPAPTSPTGSRS
jgi:hydroxylamine dehydrogenase